MCLTVTVRVNDRGCYVMKVVNAVGNRTGRGEHHDLDDQEAQRR